MNNDIYILLLDVLKSVMGILVFTMLANIYALYIIIKGYRKEKKEAVVINYDKLNKGHEL
ncbi:hypothetical protein CNEO2_570021 [Clostridium neonatale]|uniref:hypothetical protein n=1 Tax=Clostridium neonatale TaxID=137838 RepID=UPI00291B5DE8|nr:hypothetical protein [Clostridium neonatale]CAI3244142.1 hypothetical protein CNEO2_570021 [Clostridium neonatale]CAI3539634.1 hypothetical protein CNEO4_170021 [Clostridium neonatale]